MKNGTIPGSRNGTVGIQKPRWAPGKKGICPNCGKEGVSYSRNLQLYVCWLCHNWKGVVPLMNKYCEPHCWPAAKISKKPVIIDDYTGTGNCDWVGCNKAAVLKLRFYKNPPEPTGAAIV